MQARRAWGARQALLELSALAAYGFLLERAAMSVFASHRYAEGWRVAPGGVPLAVAVVWAAVIVSCAALAPGRGARRAGTAALLAVSLDLGIEPAAVSAGLWEWTPPGPWLGMPIGNSVGWAVIVAGYVAGLDRWPARRRPLDTIARRLVLAAGCIAALLAVGLVWTRAGAERIFAAEAGWLVFAGVLATTAVLLRRPRPAGPAAMALLVVAVTFVADAARAGGPVLAAALAPALLAASVAARAAAKRATGTASSG